MQRVALFILLAGCTGDIATVANASDSLVDPLNPGGATVLSCSARVLAVGDTGGASDGDPVLMLTLSLTPPHHKPYVATIQATVSKFKILKPGDTLRRVACDPDDPQKEFWPSHVILEF